ncbi:MAG: hypothetical protein Q9187_004384, partial [Circinaria calcarea]
AKTSNCVAAKGIDTFVLIISNPDWDQNSDDRVPINSSISFNLSLDHNLQTLSTNTVSRGVDVEGLLYVPDIPASDPCFNTSQNYVHPNVTRRLNLPNADYFLIAYAPWISPNCTLSYLASAGIDSARAFIFYIPDGSRDAPPPIKDPYWGLNDGGTWKSQNNYPVYAIPGFYGALLMQQLALYSGNMTDVPEGQLLSGNFDTRDYVRLYTTINTGRAPTLPSLWVFLLIVLAMMLTIMFMTSVLMHYVQRRRRRELRRLIAEGAVDLEALGIKRIKVPQEVLDKMPLYVYVSKDEAKQSSNDHLLPPPAAFSNKSGKDLTQPKEATTAANTNSSNCKTNLNPSSLLSPSNNASSSSSCMLPHRQLPYAQETCPICLDDFISRESRVRQLPCNHVYHPGCIDPFLRDNSSLCPVCKAKVLPKGYCPTEVTNAMVRRERLVREMRESVTAQNSAGNEITLPSRPVVVGRRMASFHRHLRGLNIIGGRRISSAPAAISIEMRSLGERPGLTPVGTPPTRRSAFIDRQDWVRRRTAALLGHQVMAEDEDNQRHARLPRWRKALGAVFPGFR